MIYLTYSILLPTVYFLVFPVICTVYLSADYTFVIDAMSKACSFIFIVIIGQFI